MSLAWIALLVFSVQCSTQETLADRQSLPTPMPPATHLSAFEKSYPAGKQIEASLYFPQIFNPDRIWQDAAIWTDNLPPSANEVVLFRHSFTLAENLDAAQLHVFADTRYEVWVDGNWIGRGPARFSRTLHEYDVYPLDSLPAGSHLIAVLVQWAPNKRRSESTTPHLIAHIQGDNEGKVVVPVSTNTAWKCELSSAWRQDAVPVHSWELIGPTELLDLRQLPADWYQPGFDDSAWENAVTISPPKSSYRSRSIPNLVERQVPATVIDAGLLSPGYKVGEITPPAAQPFNLDFSSASPAAFTLNALAIPGETAASITLDGDILSWQAVDPARPDLYAAQVQTFPGDHRLSFTGIPARGMTFSVPAQNFSYLQFPFTQGINAGRRLLLADMESNPQDVKIIHQPDLNLEFGPQPSYAVLDMGRTVLGRLQARVQGPAGTVIDIGWDERLIEGTSRPLPYPGSLHPEWDQVDSWVLDDNSRSIKTIDARAGRYILIAVWGDAPVKISDVTVLEERYPAAVKGSFTSSDPLLDQVWQIGLDTLYPNMLDGYTDTPWRERGQWWGDAYIADHINQVTLGDTLLIKRGLSYMADAFPNSLAPGLAPNSNSTHMLDYAMLWVFNLSDYYQHTADRPFLRDLYPALRRFMDHLATFENPSTGLLDLPQAQWSETAYVESLGYHSRYGQSTALNASYYAALLQAAYLATQVDDPGHAQVWQDKAAKVKEKTNEMLFLPGEGRYATNIYQGQAYPPTPHAQAWALAYGLALPENADQVTTSLIDLLSPDPQAPNLDIYGMFWVLQALGRNNRIDAGLEIIHNYYGYLLDSGATTWWERFDADKYQSASLSHVWGASPTWFLSSYVLGARWIGPGRWQVNPSFSGVSYAAGSVPVDDGTLSVEWELPICAQGSVDVNSESGTQGEIIMPLNRPVIRVELDGSVIWENGAALIDGIASSPNGLHIPLPSGHHTLAIQFDC